MTSAEATTRRLVAAVLVILAAGLFLHRSPRRAHEVTVLRGTTRIVNSDSTAIFFDGSRIGGPPLRVFEEDSGFIVAGTHWFDGQSWHDDGPPACLEPGSRRQQVEMGLLEAEATEDAPGHAVVVWLKCLEGIR